MLLAVGDVTSSAARILYECEPIEPQSMPWGLDALPVFGGREAHQSVECPLKVTVKLWKHQSISIYILSFPPNAMQCVCCAELIESNANANANAPMDWGCRFG